MQHQKISAFTFVELIIVVIILGILGSIGFLSYTNYIAGSRDANRISQVKDIYKGLQLYSTNKLLPLPDESVTITASGSIVGYQGYAGANILQQINYTSGGKDPKDNQYFTYVVSKNKKSLQVLSFLEEQDNLEKEVASHISSFGATAKNLVPNKLLPQTYAAIDYSSRYPKSVGSKLGVILSENTNIPVQEVASIQTVGELDVITSGNTYKAVFDDTSSLTGSGTRLLSLNPDYNCERLSQTGKMRGDGYYTINPGGTKYKIYCPLNPPTNLLTVDWELGSGSIGNFGGNGGHSENERILYQTPLGATDIVWQGVPDGGSGGDGGWNNGGIPIDHTKTYRLSVWIKKTGDTNGTTYLGTNPGVLNLNDTVNGNPYFWAADLPTLDDWYLVVGYVHGSGDPSTTSYGGIYDPKTGQKSSLVVTDYKFDVSATVITHRSYLYYNTNSTNRQYFYDPRIEEIDASDIGDVKDLLPVLQ